MVVVGVDVSKNKSDFCAKNDAGQIIWGPETIPHNKEGLEFICSKISDLRDETRVVMENTSMYWRQPAYFLAGQGFYVSVPNAILVHAYRANSIRQVKTDKADAIRIAEYGLAFWNELKRFDPNDEAREILMLYARLYKKQTDMCIAMRNNLIAMCDQAFPEANNLFGVGYNKKGKIKWIEFLYEFWHANEVLKDDYEGFRNHYRTWCLDNGFNFYNKTAEKIYRHAAAVIPTFPYNEGIKSLIRKTASYLIQLYDEMRSTGELIMDMAQAFPEYKIVLEIPCCKSIAGAMLMAEVGDITRFSNKHALVAYAGLDAPPFQSGTFESKKRHVSKKGSPHLRRNAYMIAQMVYINGCAGDPIYDFMKKKRNEGKPYNVCMVAGAAKLLKIYYGKVKEFYAENNL